MASNKWRIEWILRTELDKYARQFTKEIGEEIERAYEITWDNFYKVWRDWQNNYRSNTNRSKLDETDNNPFMLQASDKYWEIGNTGDFKIEDLSKDPDSKNYKAAVTLDPKYIKGTRKSLWGRRKGKVYPNKKIFSMMFDSGIFGFNRAIIDESWYKTKKSQRKYYTIHRWKGKDNPDRDRILKKIKSEMRIPKTAKKKPVDDMRIQYNKIISKKHLDQKWNEIVGNLDKDLLRLSKSK